MKTILYHNQNCSKSCAVLEKMTELTPDFEIVNYLENPPSKAQLIEILSFLKIPAEDLIRKNEPVFKERFSNTQLTEEKNQVTQQRDVMQKNYDSASQVIRQKEDVIDVASTLHASNFNIVGLKEKSSGREKETSKAKKVDKIRITFDVDENRVTQSGTKDIYIAITSPDGKPVSVEALGSGKMVTRDNIERPFTKKININYSQGQKLPVTVEWSQNSDFQTGNYKIEIYNNGFKIGEGVVNFKKGGLFG